MMCEHPAQGLAHCRGSGGDVHSTVRAQRRGRNSYWVCVDIEKGFSEKVTSKLRPEGGVKINQAKRGEEECSMEEASLFAKNCSW